MPWQKRVQKRSQSNPYPLLLPNNCTPSFDHQQQHFSSSSSITPEMKIPPSPWLPTSASIDHTSTAEPMYPHKIENPSPLPLRLAGYQASASPHLSATALLQKATQMGATMSRPADQNGQIMPAAHSTSNSIGFSHGSTTTTAPPHTLQEVMMMMMMMAGSTSKRDQDFVTTTTSASVDSAVRRKDQEGGGDGLTRDFLGPRAFSHKDILSMASSAGLPNCMTTTTTTSSSFQQCQQNNSKPWHDMRSYHHEKYDVSSEFHTKHS
ncbi:protein indeterminate-domain 11-like [Iris pallida]|uniref:Protein indeterminate-domain 11-like n=1 Tax=Iris pallida TaxID=29817 RepID=A0AAX6G2N6_IRIPA|nr:protein indeterminate-domain 11-like [Iris pallida]